MKNSEKRPVAVFDIDGTIFRNSLLIELHWKMVKEGIIPRSAIKSLDKKYWLWVRRKGTYDDYLYAVIASFDKYIKGVSVKTIERLARKVVKVQSEIVYRYTRNLVAKLSKTHLMVAISGSPEIIVKAFAGAWGFDYYIGSVHEVKGMRFTGKKIFVPAEDKEESLRILEKRHGFKLGRGSVGVGDTESDIKILQLVEKPICFNPTEQLFKVAARRGWLSVVERKDIMFEIKKNKVLKVYGRRTES